MEQVMLFARLALFALLALVVWEKSGELQTSVASWLQLIERQWKYETGSGRIQVWQDHWCFFRFRRDTNDFLHPISWDLNVGSPPRTKSPSTYSLISRFFKDTAKSTTNSKTKCVVLKFVLQLCFVSLPSRCQQYLHNRVSPWPFSLRP